MHVCAACIGSALDVTALCQLTDIWNRTICSSKVSWCIASLVAYFEIWTFFSQYIIQTKPCCFDVNELFNTLYHAVNFNCLIVRFCESIVFMIFNKYNYVISDNPFMSFLSKQVPLLSSPTIRKTTICFPQHLIHILSNAS